MSSFTGNGAVEVDDLVVRAKSDREALGRLYDRYYAIVHRYCCRRVFDRATADDITSEVFLHVAANLRSFPGTTDADFRCWIYRIATNAINAGLRQRFRRHALLDRAFRLGWLASADGPSPTVAGEIEWETVADALLTLPVREQTALTLRYLEGMAYEEVAAVLGARPATVRVIVSRALERLRSRLNARPTPGTAAGGKQSP